MSAEIKDILSVGTINAKMNIHALTLPKLTGGKTGCKLAGSCKGK